MDAITSFILSLDWFLFFTFAAKTVGLLVVVLTMVSYTVYAERRVSAVMQDRLGPNRTGIPLTLFGFKKDINFQGLGQPIADALKLLLKEDFTPAHVKKFYYWMAPALGISAVILSLSVIPFGSSLNFDFVLNKIFGKNFGPIPMVIANVNIGVLFMFAISSLGVYGIVLAGYSSNSKYPFLGGIRASSQMISYELALGLSVIPIFLVLGKLNLVEAVKYQTLHGWLLLPVTKIDLWFKGQIPFSRILTGQELLLWIPMLISFVIFTVSLFAETNRTPFDLPEAEQELAGGYNIEYSSMKFALFFLGEYAAMIAGSALIVTLFLGGWHLPFVPDGSNTLGLGFLHFFPAWIWGLVNIGVFFGKVALLLFFFIWVRWTVPRFRYDQLMELGWIWFFEIAIVNIFLTAGILALIPN
jgi:NADH-quinone oxidoreductase subunit H